MALPGLSFLKTHTGNFFAQGPADAQGLIRVDRVFLNQNIGKQLIIPHVRTQIEAAFLRYQKFTFNF